MDDIIVLMTCFSAILKANYGYPLANAQIFFYFYASGSIEAPLTSSSSEYGGLASECSIMVAMIADYAVIGFVKFAN